MCWFINWFHEITEDEATENNIGNKKLKEVELPHSNTKKKKKICCYKFTDILKSKLKVCVAQLDYKSKNKYVTHNFFIRIILSPLSCISLNDNIVKYLNVVTCLCFSYFLIQMKSSCMKNFKQRNLSSSIIHSFNEVWRVIKKNVNIEADFKTHESK